MGRVASNKRRIHNHVFDLSQKRHIHKNKAVYNTFKIGGQHMYNEPSATVSEPNADNAALSAAAPAPLVFRFSKSEAKSVNGFFNAGRMAMVPALIGTFATGKSAIDKSNGMRLAASILGMYANIMEFFFSSERQPTLGELSLTHGAWTHKNDTMHAEMQGKLPDQAKVEIDRILDHATLPKNSIVVGYDKKRDRTIISVADAVFPDLQKQMRETLRYRQEAVGALLDPARRCDTMSSDGKTVVTGIGLDGMSVPQIHALQTLLKHDLDIASDIRIEEAHHRLQIEAKDQSKFSDFAAPYLKERANAIRIGNTNQDDYTPGFIETLTRPDKHPKQHGLLIGAIASNALRIGAGFKAEKMNNGTMQRSPLESYSSIWSMLTYLIDYMPEKRRHNDSLVAGVQSSYSGLEGGLHQVGDYLNERPLLASMVLKVPTVAMRLRDAFAPGKDDMPKKIGAIMDGVRAVMTATLHKGDYGR